MPAILVLLKYIFLGIMAVIGLFLIVMMVCLLASYIEFLKTEYWLEKGNK